MKNNIHTTILGLASILLLFLSACKNPSAVKSVADDVISNAAKGAKGSASEALESGSKTFAKAASGAVFENAPIQLSSGLTAKLKSKEGSNIIVEISDGIKVVNKAINCVEDVKEYTGIESQTIINQICKHYVTATMRR
jgi:hypothetical protein